LGEGIPIYKKKEEYISEIRPYTEMGVYSYLKDKYGHEFF